MSGQGKAAVIGAGVSGLTTALTLREAGFEVEIASAEPTAATTSAVAAAIWHPFYQDPDDTYLRRAALTRERLAALADDPLSGVRIRRLTEYLRDRSAPPWWMAEMDPIEVAARPEGYRGAFEVAVPVADTSRYLPYLESLAAVRGVAIVRRDVASLRDEAARADLVVNCAGFGAGRLAGDASMDLVRGVALRCASPAAPLGCHIDDSDPRRPTYVIERCEDLVLGGTADPGLVSTITPTPVIEEVQRRCIELVPQIAGLEVREVAVGFRPGRRAVRLEHDPDLPNVVHNYGHGGAGFTLSWGCAADVVSAARSSTLDPAQRS